jgi:hypothetical protein
LLCEVAVCTRLCELTEISGGARRHRCGVAQSSSSELATQARPSQPHSRLMMAVHVGSRLAYSGSPTNSRTPTPTDRIRLHHPLRVYNTPTL